MNEIDLRNVELGHSFTHNELLQHFRAVWGGISFPGRRPGFCVVVGMGHEKMCGRYIIYLLDEYESGDTRKLVRQAGALDVKYALSTLKSYYRPCDSGRWFGDDKNDAASRLIEEMNREQHRDGSEEGREPFRLTPTSMLEMEGFYLFALSTLKDLLNAERRMLFLKDSKILGYMSEIENGQSSELKLGDYPGIEALAFAVLEARDWAE
ncbi:MAG: hypothetical protein JSW66_15190, partial [Phycisphaerales bacterium]